MLLSQDDWSFWLCCRAGECPFVGGVLSLRANLACSATPHRSKPSTMGNLCCTTASDTDDEPETPLSLTLDRFLVVFFLCFGAAIKTYPLRRPSGQTHDKFLAASCPSFRATTKYGNSDAIARPLRPAFRTTLKASRLRTARSTPRSARRTCATTSASFRRLRFAQSSKVRN